MRLTPIWRLVGVIAVLTLGLAGWSHQAFGAMADAAPHAFAASSAAAAPTFSGLHTDGAHLVNEQGQTVQLQGVNISQLDYSCAPSYNALAASSYPALKAWHINAVVIPANVYYWTGAKAGCDAAAYQARVYAAVDTALAQGMYPMISAYESGYDTINMMPDSHTEQTVNDWATHYANDPRVLIQVFNEPHSGNGYTVTPAIWRDGDPSRGYIGLERLIQDVNARAPHSVVLANSNNYGGVIGQLVSAGYSLTGTNIAYAVHIYDNGGNRDATKWPQDFATLAQTSPVVATEYGTNIGASDCDVTFLNQIQPFMAAHLAGWFAWQWNPDSTNYCSRANLIQPANSSALATGAPSRFGAIVQTFYLSDGIGGTAAPAPGSPPTTTPTATNTPAPTNTPSPTTPPPPTSGISPVAGIPGTWQLAANDTFSGSAVDTNQWSTYQGFPTSSSNTKWDASACAVSGNTLSLNVLARASGGRPYTACGLASTYSATYGLWEYRFQEDQGDWQAVGLLWPDASNWPPEIDGCEPNATRSDCMTTLHYGAANTLDQAHTATDGTQWHVMDILWQPNSVTWYLDGHAVHTATTGVPNESMHFALQVEARPGTTSANVGAMRVSYVRVFLAGASAPTPTPTAKAPTPMPPVVVTATTDTSGSLPANSNAQPAAATTTSTGVIAGTDNSLLPAQPSAPATPEQSVCANWRRITLGQWLVAGIDGNPSPCMRVIWDNLEDANN